MKTLKKLLLLTLLFAVVMAMSISVMQTAFALEGEPIEEDVEPIEETQVIAENGILSEVIADWKVKIIAFIGGLTITNVLALLLLFIKARGKNLTLKEAFGSVKTKLSTTENTASFLQLENEKLKKTLESFPTVEQLFGGVSKDIESLVADTIKKVIADSNTVSNSTLGNTEVISTQLANISKALSVAYKNNDTVLNLLANSPSTVAVDKLAKAVACLQDFVAQKTGTDGKELQAYIQKTISEVQNG